MEGAKNVLTDDTSVLPAGVGVITSGGSLPNLAGRRRRGATVDALRHRAQDAGNSQDSGGGGGGFSDSATSEYGESEAGNPSVPRNSVGGKRIKRGEFPEVGAGGELLREAGGTSDGAGTGTDASAGTDAGTDASAGAGAGRTTRKALSVGLPALESAEGGEMPISGTTAPTKATQRAGRGKGSASAPAPAPVAGADGIEALLGGLDSLCLLGLSEGFGLLSMYRGEHWRVESARLQPIAANFALAIRQYLPAVASQLEKQAPLTAGLIQLGTLVAPIIAAEAIYISQQNRNMKTQEGIKSSENITAVSG